MRDQGEVNSTRVVVLFLVLILSSGQVGITAAEDLREPKLLGAATGFVTTASRATDADVAALRAAGLEPFRVFTDFGVIAARGDAHAWAAAEHLPGILRASAGLPSLRLASATGLIAAQARNAWDAKSTSTASAVTPGGQLVDGQGIGVAIVDSGLDATHPDLTDAVVRNMQWACMTPLLTSAETATCYGDSVLSGADCCGLGSQLLYDHVATGCTDVFWIEARHDDALGHGTHVAGLVGGRGVASAGRFMGAAPGTRLYGLGAGAGPDYIYVIEAMNWIHCHHSEEGIRVVLNAWGAGGDFDPVDPVNRAVDALVLDGMVVVFPVDNDGGDGGDDRINRFAKNPRRGVLAVASYDDLQVADRDAALSAFSSRGWSDDANRSHWPDLSAPGSLVTSTWAKDAKGASSPELAYLPDYSVQSGSSMAAATVAGIAALLVQANPLLAPAAVEDVLVETARSFPTPGGYVADPTRPLAGGTNFGAGHGLVDALAALHDLRVGASGGSSLAQVAAVGHVFTPGIDAQVVAGLQWTVPAGQVVNLGERQIRSGNASAYPVAAGQAAWFRVEGPDGVALIAAAVEAEELSAGNFRVDAPHIFPAPGDYTVEAELDFGAGPLAIDAFSVQAV